MGRGTPVVQKEAPEGVAELVYAEAQARMDGAEMDAQPVGGFTPAQASPVDELDHLALYAAGLPSETRTCSAEPVTHKWVECLSLDIQSSEAAHSKHKW